MSTSLWHRRSEGNRRHKENSKCRVAAQSLIYATQGLVCSEFGSELSWSPPFLNRRVILNMPRCSEDSGYLLSCAASHHHLDGASRLPYTSWLAPFSWPQQIQSSVQVGKVRRGQVSPSAAAHTELTVAARDIFLMHLHISGQCLESYRGQGLVFAGQISTKQGSNRGTCPAWGESLDRSV